MTVLYITVFGLAAFVSVLFAELMHTSEKAAATALTVAKLEQRVEELEEAQWFREGEL